uniref:Centrosomal protein of 162 kDa n=1 Tax=Syphacia muris TaxID=451379 RepID=A0A0N5AHX8_9BILA
MNRGKEKEEAKRNDLFLHISDAELLGDLPVDGEKNRILYDQIKKKQKQLKALKSKAEEKLQYRDKLDVKLKKINEKLATVQQQVKLNKIEIDDMEHQLILKEAEKRRLQKQLYEMRPKLVEKLNKVETLKKLIGNRQEILDNDTPTGKLKKRSRNSEKSASDVSLALIRKETEKSFKYPFVEVLNSHLTTLEKQNSDKQKELEQLENERNRTKKKAEEEKCELDKLEQETANIKLKNEAMLSKYEKLKSSLELEERNIAEAIKEHFEMNKALADQKQAYDEQSSKLKQITEVLTLKKMEMKDINEKVEAYEKRWDELQDVLSKIDSNTMEMINKKQEKRKEIEDIERKVNNLLVKNRIYPINSKVFNENPESLMDDTSKDNPPALVELNNSIVKQKTEAKDLEKSNKRLNSQILKLQQNKEKLSVNIKVIKSSNSKLAARIQKLKDELSARQQDYDAAKEQDNDQIKKINELQENLQKLNIEKRQVLREQKVLKHDLRQYEQSLANYKAKLNFITETSLPLQTASEKKKKSKADEIEEFRNKVKELEKEKQLLEKVLPIVNEKNQIVRSKLTTVKPYYEEQHKLEKLKAEEERFKDKLQAAKAFQNVLRIKQQGDVVIEAV